MLAYSWLWFTLSMQDFFKLRLEILPTIFRDVTPFRLVETNWSCRESLPLHIQKKVPPKRRCVGCHGVTSRKTWIFIVTTVETQTLQLRLWWTRGIAPRILSMGTIWRSVIRFTAASAPANKNLRFTQTRRLCGSQSRSRRFGEEKKETRRSYSRLTRRKVITWGSTTWARIAFYITKSGFGHTVTRRQTDNREHWTKRP